MPDLSPELISAQTPFLEEAGSPRVFIPICANCEKIRDDRGHWNRGESPIINRSEAQFTHTICPDCAGKLYPGFNPYE